MRKSSGNHLLFLPGTLLAGVLICVFLFQMDNKYTAALSGGYGYNVLQDDLDQVAFLVDGWEYYPGSLLDAEDFSGGISAENYTYIGQYPNFSAYLDSPYGTAIAFCWRTKEKLRTSRCICRSFFAQGGSTSTAFWWENKAV